MRKHSPTIAVTVAALLALGACNSQSAPVTFNQYDPQAEALKNAPPVQLPPSIIASKIYRCVDNSVYFVDFYNNNSAQISTTRSGTPTAITAPSDGAPYSGTGYTLSGGHGDRVSINGKSCRTS